MDVAERLFADRGFSATSLRDITRQAGVNVAAVNYHFGSKEGLIAEVMARRLRPINERRIAALSVLDDRAHGNVPALESVLRSFLSPAFEQVHEIDEPAAHDFAKLISRVHYEANPDVRKTLMQDFEHVLDNYRRVLRRSQPDLDADRINIRLLFVVGAMAYTLAWLESLDVLGVKDTTTRSLLDELVAFACGGVSAAPPSEQSE